MGGAWSSSARSRRKRIARSRSGHRSDPARVARRRRAARERHEAVRGGSQAYTRACQELELTSASVPPTFPLELADRLRGSGIELRVDREHFDERRRRKNATEIAGLRRAQRACEAALDVAREMLRNATVNGTLMLDGEPLTSERIKAEVERVFGEHGAYADEFIVSHGPQTAIGHEGGHGADPAGRADLVRSLSERSRDRRVHRHDAHICRRRHPRRAARVPPALQRGARPRRRRGEARRERPRALPDHVRSLRRARVPDAAHEAAGRGARQRLLPQSRPRCRPGGARAAVARAGRRRPRARAT